MRLIYDTGNTKRVQEKAHPIPFSLRIHVKLIFLLFFRKLLVLTNFIWIKISLANISFLIDFYLDYYYINNKR